MSFGASRALGRKPRSRAVGGQARACTTLRAGTTIPAGARRTPSHKWSTHHSADTAYRHALRRDAGQPKVRKLNRAIVHH